MTKFLKSGNILPQRPPNTAGRPSNKSLELKGRTPQKPRDTFHAKFRVVRLVLRAERQVIAARDEKAALEQAMAAARWRPFPAHGAHGEPYGEVTVERVVFERKSHGVRHTRLAKAPVETLEVTDLSVHAHVVDSEGGEQ
jgi:hypothetical protein